MLSAKQRTTLGEKLMDAANISLGALVFGPLISGTKPSVIVLVLGLLCWIFFASLGVRLLRDVENGTQH